MKQSSTITFFLLSLLCTCTFSCKVYLTQGDEVKKAKYDELHKQVQTAYYDLFLLAEKQYLPKTVNLDSNIVEFEYLENTSIEIIKAGNEVFKIDDKKFYLPWNGNKESSPYLFYDKKFYCRYGKDAWNNYDIQNTFLEIDLTKYLKY